jgi:multicomponent Na+:H+ antiporter subunit D
LSFSSHYPVLLIAVPLAFAALCPIVGMYKRGLCFPLSVAGAAVTCFFVFSLWGTVMSKEVVSYTLGGWKPPIGIQIRVDYVGLFMASIISVVGLLILVYSWRYTSREIDGEKIPYYYTLYMLLFASMLGFVVTGDIFNMFVFMEIFSLSSYGLVGITGQRRAVRAAFKYLLMGATSSITVLLAIAFLYSTVGSLNMEDIAARLQLGGFSSVASVALVLFLVGFAVKAALFPVHVWLPDAHSIAPSPISAVLSALVIKMGVIGILRIFFTVYTPGFADLSGTWNALMQSVAWCAAISIVLASIMAIIQRDFKVMIAYSSIAHIGYIILGLCMLTDKGLTGGLYNVLAHSLGKGCFFLVAGVIIYKHNIRRITNLRGLGRSMPVTAGAFAVASLSIVGLPPSAGFVAKWYILWGCLQKNQYVFVVMVLMGSLLSAIYCFRVVYYMFFTGARGTGIDEGPATMFVPVALLAAATVFFGIFARLVLPSLGSAAKALLAG